MTLGGLFRWRAPVWPQLFRSSATHSSCLQGFSLVSLLQVSLSWLIPGMSHLTILTNLLERSLERGNHTFPRSASCENSCCSASRDCKTSSLIPMANIIPYVWHWVA